jgi:transcriptional regulator with XRE-family HTH domain
MVCSNWYLETRSEHVRARQACAKWPYHADVDPGEVGSRGWCESTTVSGVETGKIGRPHFGTLDKLARALRVAPEELLDSRESVEQQGPVLLSLGWARDSEEGEFERGLEGASLESLDSLSRELDAEQERLQRLYGEFPRLASRGDS